MNKSDIDDTLSNVEHLSKIDLTPQSSFLVGRVL